VTDMISELYNDDCINAMYRIEDKSIAFILADFPYGSTASHWDKVIPMNLVWPHYTRIIKPNGVIALFGTQPFISLLITSNLPWYKYSYYWKKTKANGWQHSKNRPMRIIEEIAIFSPAPMGHKSLLGDRRMVYNPQGIISKGIATVKAVWHGKSMGARPNQVGKEYEQFTGFPNDLLEYANVFGMDAKHAAQKPIDLLKRLILTYTEENDIVLDNVMGSGSTGVAALQLGRRFVGIEKDTDIFNAARERIRTA